MRTDGHGFLNNQETKEQSFFTRISRIGANLISV
jgi:hypothetical protein